MASIVRLTLWSMLLLLFAVIPSLFPLPATAFGGAAFAQMLPDELMAKNLGSKEERMKKSSNDGPGMASIGSGDPEWCRPCHLNHDKVRAARARRVSKAKTAR